MLWNELTCSLPLNVVKLIGYTLPLNVVKWIGACSDVEWMISLCYVICIAWATVDYSGGWVARGKENQFLYVFLNLVWLIAPMRQIFSVCFFADFSFSDKFVAMPIL